MTKVEVLALLRELVEAAYFGHRDPDDDSDYGPDYLVDHEQLMKNIDAAIAAESEPCEPTPSTSRSRPRKPKSPKS